MTETCTGTPWNSHVQFDLHEILLISVMLLWHQKWKSHGCGVVITCSFTPRSPQSVSWNPSTKTYIKTLRTHTKGAWKACSTLMKEGVLWSYLQPEKRGERSSVFILCSLVQPCLTLACLLSLWLLPVDKYVLLQSISSIFKKTDNTFFNIS